MLLKLCCLNVYDKRMTGLETFLALSGSQGDKKTRLEIFEKDSLLRP
jgi:hypothetical protein